MLLAVILISGKTIAQNKYRISGKLNLKGSANIYLVKPENMEVLKSVQAKNGEFNIVGEVAGVTSAILILAKDTADFKISTDRKQIYLEKGIIKILSNRDQLYTSTATGTLNNDAQFDTKDIGLSVANLDKQIAAKKTAASDEFKKTDAFAQEMNALEEERINVITKASIAYIRSHPHTFPSLRILTDLSDFSEYPEINMLYQSLDEDIRNSAEGQAFREKLKILKSVSVGSVAPDISLPNTKGALVKISSFRGKYLLIDVWAGWCGPCRKENPNQVRMYQKYKNQNFTIVGISLDEERAKWEDAILKDGLTWNQLSDLKGWNSLVVRNYGLNSIPQNYLLDPNGVIIAKNLQGKTLSDKLEEIFGRK